MLGVCNEFGEPVELPGMTEPDAPTVPVPPADASHGSDSANDAYRPFANVLGRKLDDAQPVRDMDAVFEIDEWFDLVGDDLLDELIIPLEHAWS